MQASWHRMSDPGTVARFVPPGRAAWHATIANRISVGYEQAGYAAFPRSTWMTPKVRHPSTVSRRRSSRTASRCRQCAASRTTRCDVLSTVTRRCAGSALTRRSSPGDRTDPGAWLPGDVLPTRSHHQAPPRPRVVRVGPTRRHPQHSRHRRFSHGTPPPTRSANIYTSDQGLGGRAGKPTPSAKHALTGDDTHASFGLSRSSGPAEPLEAPRGSRRRSRGVPSADPAGSTCGRHRKAVVTPRPTCASGGRQPDRRWRTC